MNILLLRGFNNYFNRVVKKCSTIADYKAKSNSYLELENINFNPNDGVTAELVIGSVNQLEDNKPLAWDQVGTPDYLVCYENEGDPAVPVIKFRWFILESERTRNGQYRIALKRDVIAEHYDEVMNAPCYVEKGIVLNTNDPLLYNSEGARLNQIKKDEIQIKDESDCAWLVGYLKKGAVSASGGDDVPAVIAKDTVQYIDYNTLPTNLKNAINFVGGDKASNTCVKQDTLQIVLKFAAYSLYAQSWALKDGSAIMGYNGTDFTKKSVSQSSVYNATGKDDEPYSFNLENYTNLKSINMTSVLEAGVFSLGSVANTITKDFINNYILPTAFPSTTYKMSSEEFTRLSGSYLLKDNIFYTLSLVSSSGSPSYENFEGRNANAKAYVKAVADIAGVRGPYDGWEHIGAGDTTILSSSVFSENVVITATPAQTAASLKMHIGNVEQGQRTQCEETTYDYFAIPFIPKQYREKDIYFADGDGTIRTIDFDASICMASAIITKYGGTGEGNTLALDLQVLPYCPIDIVGYSDDKKILDLGLLSSKSYSLITIGKDNTPCSFAIFPQEANFTKYITCEEHVKKAFDIKDSDFSPVPEVPTGKSRLKPYTWYTLKDLSWVPPSGMTGVTKVATSSQNNIYLRRITKDSGDFIGEVKVNSISIDMSASNTLTIGRYISGGTQIATQTWTKKAYETADYYYQIYVDTPSFSGQYIAEALCEFLKILNLSPSSLDLKISNECDFMRLSSPNFNGMFEFKLSKFEDGLHYLNVDCSYKPFSPYIKLNPDFSGLYGADFNDATGLICGGDFSLPTISDAWIQYQLSNKNYQNLFNRQIQNLDANQQLAQDQLKWQNTIGMVTGGIGGMAGGAALGMKTGNPLIAAGGAFAGAAAGLGLAVAGAEKNQEWLNRQQQETKSYTVDMYNYQLGNIQALPQSVSKSSPLTANNKLWPILEKFSCTDAEKTVLKNKIKYNSMTIMAIGRLSNYATSSDFDKVYVKGQLIRLDTIKDDFHLIDTIYQEVNKGFYVPQE